MSGNVYICTGCHENIQQSDMLPNHADFVPRRPQHDLVPGLVGYDRGTGGESDVNVTAPLHGECHPIEVE